MRLCHHIKNDGLEWAVCEFDESFAELSLLCADTSLVDYAMRHFAHEKRRCQWLASRMLVRQLLGETVNVANTEEGKPFLVGSSVNISISHTSNYVAVAIHKTSDVGIDIERRSSRVQNVRKRFLSVAEEQFLDKSDEETSLLLHWSAKEAFYKIVGNRGGSFAGNFLISPFKLSDSCEFSISHIEQGVVIKQCTVSYLLADDYVLTLCVDK